MKKIIIILSICLLIGCGGSDRAELYEEYQEAKAKQYKSAEDKEIIEQYEDGN